MISERRMVPLILKRVDGRYYLDVQAAIYAYDLDMSTAIREGENHSKHVVILQWLRQVKQSVEEMDAE